MPNWLWIVLFVVGYLVLTQWVLPAGRSDLTNTATGPVGSQRKDTSCQLSSAKENPHDSRH